MSNFDYIPRKINKTDSWPYYGSCLIICPHSDMEHKKTQGGDGQEDQGGGHDVDIEKLFSDTASKYPQTASIVRMIQQALMTKRSTSLWSTKI